LLSGSCCLSTVPITDAMQITVSSDMENRIEDSNSTAARIVREPVFNSRPWVETVMDGGAGNQKKRQAIL
jgi:hypothetical protein